MNMMVSLSKTRSMYKSRINSFLGNLTLTRKDTSSQAVLQSFLPQ